MAAGIELHLQKATEAGIQKDLEDKERAKEIRSQKLLEDTMSKYNVIEETDTTSTGVEPDASILDSLKLPDATVHSDQEMNEDKEAGLETIMAPIESRTALFKKDPETIELNNNSNNNKYVDEEYGEMECEEGEGYEADVSGNNTAVNPGLVLLPLSQKNSWSLIDPLVSSLLLSSV